MKTAATRLLGIELPLVAPASKDPSFCVDACEAGWLGVLDGRIARLGEAVQAVCRSTERPFGLDLTMPDANWQGVAELAPSARRLAILATTETWKRFRRSMGGAVCLLRPGRIEDAAEASAAGADAIMLMLQQPGPRGALWRETLRQAASQAPGRALIASARFEDGAQMRSVLAWGAGAVRPVIEPAAATPAWLAETACRLDGERRAQPGLAAGADGARRARASREAAALRANLRRRKAQSRARDEHE